MRLSESTESVIRSFERRAGYFPEESTWSIVEHLNSYMFELLIKNINTQSNPLVILDYGAGNGAVGRLFNANGAIVDVADLSERMLARCEFARRKFNIASQILEGSYDGIILRQVLQYIGAENWKDFLSDLSSHLKAGGCLIFSQIVPYCEVDYDFWHDLIATRRPARQSFPTENEFLPICDQLGLKVVHFSHSYTRQSLKDWISHEDGKFQEEIIRLLEMRSDAVDAIWSFEQHENGDLSWRNNWVHIVARS
jgi:cyclopropane fatty-acyl-phospholipid synthase-like methyltransferase